MAANAISDEPMGLTIFPLPSQGEHSGLERSKSGALQCGIHDRSLGDVGSMSGLPKRDPSRRT
jgi:hypothetical protein